MKRILKHGLSRILPAALYHRLLRSRRIHFSGPYSSWSHASEQADGYSSPAILERVTAATREVVAGRAAFERDSIVFRNPAPDPVIMSNLTRIASTTQTLRVLDFGGSLGSSYYQHRRFITYAAKVEWHIVEQMQYVACARAEFQTDELRFYHTPDEACLGWTPHVVLLSSVLQYLEAPWPVLTLLTQIPATRWIVSRTPFHESSDDLLVVQHVPASIYRASYPAWIFSKERFINFWTQQGMLPVWHDTPEGKISDGKLSFDFRTAVCARA